MKISFPFVFDRKANKSYCRFDWKFMQKHAKRQTRAIQLIYFIFHQIKSLQNGEFIKRLLPKHCAASIFTSGLHPTANCSVIFDKFGDSKLLVGDMSVHSDITPDWVWSDFLTRIDWIYRRHLFDLNILLFKLFCMTFDLQRSIMT